MKETIAEEVSPEKIRQEYHNNWKCSAFLPTRLAELPTTKTIQSSRLAPLDQSKFQSSYEQLINVIYFPKKASIRAPAEFALARRESLNDVNNLVIYFKTSIINLNLFDAFISIARLRVTVPIMYSPREEVRNNVQRFL